MPLHPLRPAPRPSGGGSPAPDRRRPEGALGRALFRGNLDPVVLADPRGRIVSSNPATAATFGWTQHDLRAHGLPLLFDGSNPHAAAALREALHRGRYRGLVQLRRKDGASVSARVSVGAFEQAGDRRLVFLFRDEAQRLAAAATVVELEERWNALQETMHEALVVHRDGSILDVNRRFAVLLGYDRDDAVGRDLWDLLDPGGEQGLRRRSAERNPFLVTCTAQTKDRRPVHLELRSRPVRFQGEPASITVLRDATGRALLEDLHREAEQRYREIFEHSDVGIFHVDRTGVVLVNPALARTLGYASSEELVEQVRAIEDLILDPPRRDRAYRLLLSTGTIRDAELLFRKKDGMTVWLSLNVSLLKDGANDVTGIEGTATDVTLRRRESARIQFMAYHDRLTGLRNRFAFEEHLDTALARARRHKLALALLFLDVDHLKEVNDTRGHASGDLLLMEVARRLLSISRDSDTVARIGGDEFAAILPDLPLDPDGGTQRAERVVSAIERRLREAFAEEASPGGALGPIEVSIGIGLYPRHGTEAPEILRAADQRMYQEKRRKREGKG